MRKIFQRLWRQHVDSLAIWLCYQFETWQQLQAFFELSAPERCACFPGKGFDQVSESDWNAIKERALEKMAVSCSAGDA